MNLFGLEEFTSRRRTAQAELEDALRPVVKHAVSLNEDTNGWEDLLSHVSDLYEDAYYAETGERGHGPLSTWLNSLRTTLRRTKNRDKNSVERITTYLATAILSESTADASIHDEAELFLEWVDMHDSHVRPAHRQANGQVRPVGEKFNVGGHQMSYPGDPTVPIELWINCRCTVRPVLASEASMSFAISEKPWSGSASRFTDEQWRSSCILHLADTLNKSDHKLPIKEPGGALSRAGVHAAASRFGSVQAPAEAKAKAKASLRGAYKTLGEDVPDSLTAAAEQPRQTAMVAVPKGDDPVHDIGDTEKHCTLIYLEGADDDTVAALQAATEYASNTIDPFTAKVTGSGTLGPAQVWIVEAHDLNVARGIAHQDDAVNSHLRATDTHPHFIPHVTATTGDPPEDMTNADEIAFDRLAVWDGEQRTEFPLGGDMKPDKKPEDDKKDVLPGEPDPNTPPEDGPDPNEDPEDKKKKTNPAYSAVPFHTVLAPEGKWSGDGRRFRENSMSTRPLPLPFTWQKQSAGGHDGNIVVAKIEQMARVDGEIRGTGHFLAIPEADEAIGLISEFGRFGVSVDADRSEFELAENDEGVDFLSARICSACMVSIPAFSEAWVALGDAPDGFLDGEEMNAESEDGEVAEDESLVASLTALFEPKVDIFKDLAPGRTEDGPGWLTHPIDTDRLRDYWVRGEGAAEIGWGTPGDFNRCRLATAKYVKPQYLSGYCANRHYDALGFWPGRPVAGDTQPFAYETLGVEDKTPSDAISLVASVAHKAPAAWFKNPEFSIDDGRTIQGIDGTWGCPLTVTDEGQVYGHLAKWGSCHIAFPDECVTPPTSASNYAYFLTGEVPLDDGSRVPIGPITVGGGHAAGHLRLRGALAHYDQTCAAVADVTCGEDDLGIWVAGWVRPGVNKERVNELMASPLSGDWRKVNGYLDLVAALAVNTPGYGVPRARIAARNGEQISLVAAGVVEKPTVSADLDVDAFADKVALAITALHSRKNEMAALAASFGEN